MSLSDVLPQVAAAWRASGGGAVEFNFDASSKVASQIANGAPADLFLAADEEWMDFLASKGLLAPGARADLLTNELMLVTSVRSSLQVESPAALKSAPIERLALAAENVPAGKYARSALKSLDVWAQLQSKVVNGANVRQALKLAASGEVDAAVVYRSDAKSDASVRIVFRFPPGSHPPIIYPAAVLASSKLKPQAQNFLRFCQSETARKIFIDAGFGVVPAK